MRFSLLLIFVLFWVVACTTVKREPTPPEIDAWQVWYKQHEQEVQAYSRYLARRNLAEVLPMSQLLRSASAWQECQAEQFVVPPEQQWEAVTSVLRLMKHLATSGVIKGRIEVHSSYRNPALNECAGGAARSTHTSSFALDITVNDDQAAGEALCEFWRTQGEHWNMGFGVYPSGRLHIDTKRYRTWGYDKTGKQVVCRRVD